MFVGIGFIATPILILLYTNINKKRAEALKRMGGMVDLSDEEIHELGDRAPDFKYTL